MNKDWIKTFNEALSVRRIFSTYAISQMLVFNETERFQIGLNCFIKCIAKPECPVGNILILQGGVRHMDSDSYYIRTACGTSEKNVRIFVWEKLVPMVNFDFAKDVSTAIKWIKKNFPGPLTVVGFSMGGVLLWSYLSKGYDDADLYIPVCCPIDLNTFYKKICDHAVFNYLQEEALRKFGVANWEGLLKAAGTTKENHEKFVTEFIPGLNKCSPKWQNKTIWILSSDDPITQRFKKEIKLLENPPLTYWVAGGWHCCLDSIGLAMKLACKFLRLKNKGKVCKIDKL